MKQGTGKVTDSSQRMRSGLPAGQAISMETAVLNPLTQSTEVSNAGFFTQDNGELSPRAYGKHRDAEYSHVEI